MFDPYQFVRWIMGLKDGVEPEGRDKEFLGNASSTWPCALAQVRQEVAGQGLNGSEIHSLAVEVWEKTLRSLWKTWCHKPDYVAQIKDPFNYMIGSYHH